MKVVSVINCKGGVGKTTVTANLAAYVASQGKRVLMIDLDPQCSLTFSFLDTGVWDKKYKANKTLKNFFDPIVRGDQPASLPSLLIPLENLTAPFARGRKKDSYKADLISSHLEMIDVDVNLAFLLPGPTPQITALNFLRHHSHLRQGLSALKNAYDLVLIDCPPNFSTIVKNAITASDYYIIPARMDYLSTLGTETLKSHVKSYVEQYESYAKVVRNTDGGPSYLPIFLTMLGVVPTMQTIIAGTPIKAAQIFMDELTKNGYSLFPGISYNATIFGPAPATGMPVFLAALKKFFAGSAIKKIKEELDALGKEFMEKAGLLPA